MAKTVPVITDIQDLCGGLVFDPPKPIHLIHLWKLDPVESTVLETEIKDPAILLKIQKALEIDFTSRNFNWDKDEDLLYNPTFVIDIYPQGREVPEITLFVSGNIVMEDMPCATVFCVPEKDHLSSELWDILEDTVLNIPEVTIPVGRGWIFKHDPCYLKYPDSRKRLFEREKDCRKRISSTYQIPA